MQNWCIVKIIQLRLMDVNKKDRLYKVYGFIFRRMTDRLHGKTGGR